MAAAGHLSVWSFLAGERKAAALLVFHANESMLLSVSGMDPEWWDYRPVTLLRHACIRAGIASGVKRVNFLAGPNAGKLDWSETIEVHHTFAVVAGRRRSRALYGGYRSYRLLRDYTIQIRGIGSRSSLPRRGRR
jgi:CelD/BcsL family acetyltransferase involved in cellulose biosynthesis